MLACCPDFLGVGPVEVFLSGWVCAVVRYRVSFLRGRVPVCCLSLLGAGFVEVLFSGWACAIVRFRVSFPMGRVLGCSPSFLAVVLVEALLSFGKHRNRFVLYKLLQCFDLIVLFSCVSSCQRG